MDVNLEGASAVSMSASDRKTSQATYLDNLLLPMPDITMR